MDEAVRQSKRQLVAKGVTGRRVYHLAPEPGAMEGSVPDRSHAAD